MIYSSAVLCAVVGGGFCLSVCGSRLLFFVSNKKILSARFRAGVSPLVEIFDRGPSLVAISAGGPPLVAFFFFVVPSAVRVFSSRSSAGRVPRGCPPLRFSECTGYLIIDTNGGPVGEESRPAVDLQTESQVSRATSWTAEQVHIQ